jgi:hypothetical protein
MNSNLISQIFKESMLCVPAVVDSSFRMSPLNTVIINGRRGLLPDIISGRQRVPSALLRTGLLVALHHPTSKTGRLPRGGERGLLSGNQQMTVTIGGAF